MDTDTLQVDGAITGGESEGDGKGDAAEDTTGKPVKKRSTFDLLKGTGNKLRSASYRKKENGEKDPVKELRRRATLKRSNSLDSASFRAVSTEVSLLQRAIFKALCSLFSISLDLEKSDFWCIFATIF